jgi:hypothetical protein
MPGTEQSTVAVVTLNACDQAGTARSAWFDLYRKPSTHKAGEQNAGRRCKGFRDNCSYRHSASHHVISKHYRRKRLQLIAGLGAVRNMHRSAFGLASQGKLRIPVVRFHTVIQRHPQAVAFGSGNSGCFEANVEASSGMGGDKVPTPQFLRNMPFRTVVLFQVIVLPIEPVHLRPHSLLLARRRGTTA